MVFGLFGKDKGPATAEISPFQQTVEVKKNESLLQSALAAGIEFPHSCKVGTCVQCRCKLTEGKVKAIRDFSYVLSVEELQAGYILACQARVKPGDHVRVEVELETGRPKFDKQQFSAVVESVETLTHDIKALRLKIPGKLEYVAGQYAELSLPELDRPREYSFAAAAQTGGTDSLLFYIRRVPGGAFTEWLFSADRTGEVVQVDAPTGNFWLRESEQPLLLVGGGSGLAPLKAIIEDALQRHVKRDLVFLFGARAQRDLYAMDELNKLGESWQGQFEIIPVLSDEPSDSGWAGLQGFVHTAITADVVSNLVDRHAYLCGPPLMIDAAIEVMNNAGIHSDHIHYDKFLDASNLAST